MVSPFFVPMMIDKHGVGTSGYKNMVFATKNVTTTCATANNAIGDAFHVIRNGLADMLITGGAEAALTQLSFSGFASAKTNGNRDPNPETTWAL